MRRITRTQGAEIAALASILLLAGLLRLGWPGVNSFAFDEARLSLISLKMARGETFAAIGMPSSAGVPNLPAAAWVFALPYALATDPLVPTLFVGVISLCAVPGAWWLARREWGPWAGLTAALFLAASPYSVFYARNIWSQNLLAPLAVAWLWSASKKDTNWAIALNVFLAGFAFQIHFAGAALILATGWAALRFRWWRRLVPVLIGGGLAILAALPFAIQVACCEQGVIDGYRAVMERESEIDLKGVQHTLDLALGRGWAYMALGERDDVSDNTLTAAGAGLLVALGGLALLRGWVMRTSKEETPAEYHTGELALVLLLASPLLFVRHSTPVYPHYLLAGLPALALLAGASTQLFRWRLWGPLLTALMVGIAALWSSQVARSLDRTGEIVTPGGMGTPLEVVSDVAQGVPDDDPVLLFTHGDDPDIDGEAAVFSVLWWGREYRIVQGESVLILPPYPATLLATVPALQAWEEIEAAGLAVDVGQFSRREGAEPFIMTVYDGEQTPAGFEPVEPPVALDDGVLLTGWRVRQVGPRTRISTLWTVLQTPEPGTYRQFHHLRDASTLDLQTSPLLGTDVPLSSRNWQPGDQVIVMADYVLENPGEYWIDIGHYTLPSVQRFAREDGQGDSIRLGPFQFPPP